jgi:hypothetical protein
MKDAGGEIAQMAGGRKEKKLGEKWPATGRGRDRVKGKKRRDHLKKKN